MHFFFQVGRYVVVIVRTMYFDGILLTWWGSFSMPLGEREHWAEKGWDPLLYFHNVTSYHLWILLALILNVYIHLWQCQSSYLTIKTTSVCITEWEFQPYTFGLC